MPLVTAFASSWKGDLASCSLPESYQVMGRASMEAVASIVVFVVRNYLFSVTQLAARCGPMTRHQLDHQVSDLMVNNAHSLRTLGTLRWGSIRLFAKASNWFSSLSKRN